MSRGKKYQAFLSYSHRDAKVAKRLHRALENYRPPQTSGPKSADTLGPIFRDQDEMGAAPNLPDHIKTGLALSEFLVVLASPNAKASQWVNEEIRSFRELHGDDKIICALIAGDPASSFPMALVETGQEPLAADLSPKNFRLGVTQIAAALLNVGLDDLIRRDIRKLRRRVMAITVSAASALLVMGSLTWAAISARDLAEKRRQDAEGQIEFMITDLKDDLESVGRLDALDAVGQRAVSYYDNYALGDHDDDALGRRARVFHMLGSIQLRQGEFETANQYFFRAYDATDELLKHGNSSSDRIFDHSQSAFWVGNSYYRLGDYNAAEDYFEAYRNLIERLAEREGETPRVIEERIAALGNLSSIYLKTNQTERLSENLETVLAAKREYFEEDPQNLDRLLALTKTYIEIANFQIQRGQISKAISKLRTAVELLEVYEVDRVEYKLEKRKLVTRRSLASILIFKGELDEARNQLLKAEALTNTLLSIEKANIDVRFQQAENTFVAFQIAHIEGDLGKSAFYFDEFQNFLNSLEADAPGTAQLNSLDTASAPLPLYLAVLKNDKSLIEKEAKTLYDATHTVMAASFYKGDADSELLSYLLALMALQKEEELRAIDQLCAQYSAKLTYQVKAGLKIALGDDTCPQTEPTQPYPVMNFRSAAERLANMK